MDANKTTPNETAPTTFAVGNQVRVTPTGVFGRITGLQPRADGSPEYRVDWIDSAGQHNAEWYPSRELTIAT